MLGLCFRVYVRRSQGAGTDPAKDSMHRACRRGQGLPSDLPKDSLCLHLVVIDCKFVVRKVFGMTLPKTACPGHAIELDALKCPILSVLRKGTDFLQTQWVMCMALPHMWNKKKGALIKPWPPREVFQNHLCVAQFHLPKVTEIRLHASHRTQECSASFQACVSLCFRRVVTQRGRSPSLIFCLEISTCVACSRCNQVLCFPSLFSLAPPTPPPQGKRGVLRSAVMHVQLLDLQPVLLRSAVSHIQLLDLQPVLLRSAVSHVQLLDLQPVLLRSAVSHVQLWIFSLWCYHHVFFLSSFARSSHLDPKGYVTNADSAAWR